MNGIKNMKFIEEKESKRKQIQLCYKFAIFFITLHSI